VAAEFLRRKADEYRALSEEHTVAGDNERAVWVVVEVTLRELAEALEHVELEAG